MFYPFFIEQTTLSHVYVVCCFFILYFDFFLFLGENPAAMQHANSARWTPITLVVFFLTLIVFGHNNLR